MQDVGDAAQGTEGVTFVAGGLKPADLLLGGLEELREVLLGKPGLFAQGGNLQRHIPGLTGALKAGGKPRISHLFIEVPVEIGLFHGFVLSCQSRIRSRAVWTSRTGMAWPLLRMPCTATIRRYFTKNHNTRVLSLPTWRSSNSPLPSDLDNGSR